MKYHTRESRKLSETGLIIFILLLLQAACDSPPAVYTSYQQKILASRNEKDSLFRYAEDTPIPADLLDSFEGLIYYDPDSSFRAKGFLKKNTVPDTIKLKTSTDRMPEYIGFGHVQFIMKDDTFVLSVFQNKKLVVEGIDPGHLFIPFRDITSGNGTYGGGRYIESSIPTEGDSILLDFNMAYNPYCAYNHKYSCVLPPAENYIDIPITAGEKKFSGH